MLVFQIILSTNQLISRLQSFDPRFDALLRTPITVDVTKRLTRKDTPAVVKHHRKSTDNTGTSGRLSILGLIHSQYPLTVYTITSGYVTVQ